jgi:hypothetical protein
LASASTNDSDTNPSGLIVGSGSGTTVGTTAHTGSICGSSQSPSALHTRKSPQSTWLKHSGGIPSVSVSPNVSVSP